MHNGPQVQDDGRSDATTQADLGGKALNRDERPEISYWCNRCGTAVGPRKKQPERYVSHEEHNKLCWPDGKSGIDYVECALCKFSGTKITQHVKSAHGLAKEVYLQLHGPVMSSTSKMKHSVASRSRESWITKKKNAGESLSEYRQTMSRSVSHAIMSDDEERERRSRLLGELNKRQDFRDRASETAKRTSARIDILAKRTQNLARWREDNPEKFSAITEKCLLTKSSKPERILYDMCKCVLGDETTKQLQIQHPDIPNKTKRARIDIGHRGKKILVEFDGPFHFKSILGQEYLDRRRLRDASIEKYATEHGYLLVRVSYDTYAKGRFTDEAKKMITEAIQSSDRSAVIRIGSMF